MRFLCSIVLAVTVGAAAVLACSSLLVPVAGAEEPPARAERALDHMYVKYMDPARRDALLDRLASTGAETVQTMGPWDHMEPSADDVYSWAWMDDFIAEAEARGLKVRMQVSATPDWVHPYLIGSMEKSDRVWAPPRGSQELALYRDFIYDLVSRYGTRISSYELWNEPNHEGFWTGGSGPEPAEYAALLRAGYFGAKKANPNVQIMSAGLSMNDIGYTRKMYDEIQKYPDAGANNNFFDIFGIHPYAHRSGSPLAPGADPSGHYYDSTWGPKNGAFLGFEYIRDVMVARGDSDKKLWIGEFGYTVEEGGWLDPVTEEQRASYLKEAYGLIDERPYVLGMCWYAYYRSDDKSIFYEDTQTETPAFKAFREVASGGTPPVSSATRTFSPLADARVSQLRPNTPLGSRRSLVADQDPGRISFLKFDVSGVGTTRTVRNATLHLYVKDGGGSFDGPGVRSSANTWTEGGVTWNTRPAYLTPLQGDKGTVAGASWMTFDVTNLVKGDGTVTLAVQPTSADGTYMYSREGAVKPKLVVTLGG